MPSQDGHGNGLSDTYAHIGKGWSTAFYIDDDCDGYGIGYEYVLGPDIDDTNATINTTASAEAVYGSFSVMANIKSMLSATRGYTNIQNIYFVSPTGNDSTGAPNDITKDFLILTEGFGAGKKGAE